MRSLEIITRGTEVRRLSIPKENEAGSLRGFNITSDTRYDFYGPSLERSREWMELKLGI